MIFYPDTVWKKDICFYLDGSSFVHKIHPANQASTDLVLESREKTMSLKQGLTSKGKKTGLEGRVVHFIVWDSCVFL